MQTSPKPSTPVTKSRGSIRASIKSQASSRSLPSPFFKNAIAPSARPDATNLSPGALTGALRPGAANAGLSRRSVHLWQDEDNHELQVPEQLYSLLSPEASTNRPTDKAKPKLKAPQMLRGKVPKGWINRVLKVRGTVFGAIGLPSGDSFAGADVYVVVKGIRSNNRLVNIHMTKAKRSTGSPVWEEDFEFKCPSSWATVELVGLKFIVYDLNGKRTSWQGSDNFLGGADLDLATIMPKRTLRFDLELGGLEGSEIKRERSRITVTIEIERVLEEKPPRALSQLHDSMFHLTSIVQVSCKIQRANDLMNMDVASLSDPYVIVRAVLLGGEVVELYRTAVVDDTLNPEFNESFQTNFEPGDEPLLLIFDLWDWDEDDGDKPMQSTNSLGDHLGTAVLSLHGCCNADKPKKHKMKLQGKHQLYESLMEMKLAEGEKSIAAFESDTNPRRGRKTSKQKRLGSQVLANQVDMRQMDYEGSLLSRLARQAYVRMVGPITAFRDKVFSAAGMQVEKQSTLTIKILVKTETRAMPHGHLLSVPIEITDADDALRCVQLPDWKLAPFQIPPILTRPGRPPQGRLQGFTKITFIYGHMFGAINLPRTPRCDPYAIIHAASALGRQAFVHRTQKIKNTSCPSWDEAFYVAVPQDMDISCLIVTVKSDAEEATAGMSESEKEAQSVIGTATFDVSTLQNMEATHEDSPLQFSTKRAAAAAEAARKTVGGFRRPGYISMEVRVEQRVMPFYLVQEIGDEVIAGRTYNLTRLPPVGSAYNDFSQDEVLEPSWEAAGKTVHKLMQTRQLLEASRQLSLSDTKWDKPKPSRIWGRAPEEERETLPAMTEDLWDHEKSNQEEPEQRTENWIAAGIGRPIPRTQSLPTLHTRFRPGADFRRGREEEASSPILRS